MDKSAGLLKHKSVFNELQVCIYMVQGSTLGNIEILGKQN